VEATISKNTLFFSSASNAVVFPSFPFCSPSVAASKFDLAGVEKSSRKSEVASVEKDFLDRAHRISRGFCFLICPGHAINFRG